MKILYLIGNGFDKNLGLPTSYMEFYDYYLSDKLKIGLYDKNVANLQKEIGKNRENWSDLEYALGKYLSNIKGADEADALHKSIKLGLLEYLYDVTGGYSCNAEERNKFIANLVSPEDFLLPVDRRVIVDYKNNKGGYKNLNVISYNYDDIFEKITNYNSRQIKLNNNYYTLDNVIHIHGTLKEGMIIGVNDETQISNVSLLESSLISNKFIKSNYCKIAKNGRDETCISLISSTDLFYMFGLSIGETDKRWWKCIATRMRTSDAKLVIFWFDNNDSFSTQELAERFEEEKRVKDMFLGFSGFDEKTKDVLMNRIYVRIFTPNDNGLFKIKLDNERELDSTVEYSKCSIFADGKYDESSRIGVSDHEFKVSI